jgi:hypothetical protein
MIDQNTYLRYRLGALRDSMLRQFTRKNETDCSLDLARRDGRLLGVCGEFLMEYKLNVAYISNERDSLDASVAIRSKISLTNEFKIAIALLEIPVSGCTCLSTVFIPS